MSENQKEKGVIEKVEQIFKDSEEKIDKILKGKVLSDISKIDKKLVIQIDKDTTEQIETMLKDNVMSDISQVLSVVGSILDFETFMNVMDTVLDILIDSTKNATTTLKESIKKLKQ